MTRGRRRCVHAKRSGISRRRRAGTRHRRDLGFGEAELGISVTGAPPTHAGEMNAPGSPIDRAMYSSAVSRGRRSPAQLGAAAKEGNSSNPAVPSGPSWHDAHPSARNSWAPTAPAKTVVAPSATASSSPRSHVAIGETLLNRCFRVGEGGLEPPHPFEYWHLKPARLPFRHSPEWRGKANRQIDGQTTPKCARDRSRNSRRRVTRRPRPTGATARDIARA
jgi:hypothetical protein